MSSSSALAASGVAKGCSDAAGIDELSVIEPGRAQPAVRLRKVSWFEEAGDDVSPVERPVNSALEAAGDPWAQQARLFVAITRPGSQYSARLDRSDDRPESARQA